MPVGLFADTASLRTFMEENPPGPVEGVEREDAPLFHACDVNGCGPSIPFGYSVTQFVEGKPVHREALWDTNEDVLDDSIITRFDGWPFIQ